MIGGLRDGSPWFLWKSPRVVRLGQVPMQNCTTKSVELFS